jgi:hypothetical protein
MGSGAASHTPNARAAKGDNSHLNSGPVDEDALRSAIVNGESYHRSCVRLVGKWAQQGVPFLDAQKRLYAAFDQVESFGRDARWQKRRDDVSRIVRDIYDAEAKQRDEAAAGSDGAIPHEFSDEALALQFAENHAAELRDVASLGRWHIWTGSHWRADDTLQAFDLARAVCRRAAALIPPNKRLAFAVASARTLSPCHRFHPAEVNSRISQCSAAHAAFALRLLPRPSRLLIFEATMRSLLLQPGDS